MLRHIILYDSASYYINAIIFIIHKTTTEDILTNTTFIKKTILFSIKIKYRLIIVEFKKVYS